MRQRLLSCATLVLLALLGLGCAASVSRAADLPRVAVTDLTYEEKVSSYFSYSEVRDRSRVNAHQGPYTGSYQESEDFSAVSATGEITRIERGELHKLTGATRGALLKSGRYRLVQAKPLPNPDQPVALFDIIGRIKQGLYPGADYVLFGTISAIDSRYEAVPIQGSTAINYMLNLEVVVDFSLVNTRTYEVAAAFTAMGEGRDSRLVSTPGTLISLSRARVVQETSQSLADAVALELAGQGPMTSRASPPILGPVTTYR